MRDKNHEPRIPNKPAASAFVYAARSIPFFRIYSRLRATRLALANRKAIVDGTLKVKLDCLVVGPGGSGSTQLIQHISKFFVCNSAHDKDGLKHLPSPPPKEVAERIIFVAGNFSEIKRSLSRRGYLPFQLMKLKPYGSSFRQGSSWSLQYLVGLQEAKFSEEAVVDTLFVHYDELFESAQIISDFLGHKPGFIESFPQRQERLSR